MGDPWNGLAAVSPTVLVEARLQAHHAVQWVTRAARANLPAVDDDSQSSLAWSAEDGALLSQPLAAPDGARYSIGLAVETLRLFVRTEAASVGEFALDGRRDVEAGAWLDGLTKTLGLRSPGGVVLPYAIPSHPVAEGAPYAAVAQRAERAALACWYGAADDILRETRAALATIGRGAGEVRCWPHHFDIATLLDLTAGGHATAASIGIGLSPGDASYAQPYFYISPWPAPPPEQALPDLPPPGEWHRQGFTAAIARAEAIVGLARPRDSVRRLIDAALSIGRAMLGA